MVTCCILGCPNSCYGKADRNISYHLFPHPLNEKFRNSQWLSAINNPRVIRKDPIKQLQLYRVCRRHFAADCFNGACKRLLNTAIPTLHLNNGSTKNKQRLATKDPLFADSHSEQIDLLQQLSNDQAPSIDFKVDDSVAGNGVVFETNYLLEEEPGSFPQAAVSNEYMEMVLCEAEETTNSYVASNACNTDESSLNSETVYSESMTDIEDAAEVEYIDIIDEIDDETMFICK